MYSRELPFHATVTERELLTGPGSQKETWHVVLNLEGSGIRYEAGDCIGVIPANDVQLARETAQALGKPGLESFFIERATITRVNKRVLKAFGLTDPESLNNYPSTNTLLDLAHARPNTRLDEKVLRKLLPPLLPRFYSIASAQRVVGTEVHLTIRCQGVCTDFLCHRVPIGEPLVPLYVQKAETFRLPDNPQTPIIMVGPGTGVAPYRAFLQERKASGAPGPNWLFFGEWTQKNEFFYESFWTQLTQAGLLRLDTAFSRDQKDKVYVQHRMLDQARELWQWLQKGAHLYVCGDAKRMARDVQATVQQIAEQEGGLDAEAARQYVRDLRRTKRYLADVY